MTASRSIPPRWVKRRATRPSTAGARCVVPSAIRTLRDDVRAHHTDAGVNVPTQGVYAVFAHVTLAPSTSVPDPASAAACSEDVDRLPEDLPVEETAVPARRLEGARGQVARPRSCGDEGCGHTTHPVLRGGSRRSSPTVDGDDPAAALGHGGRVGGRWRRVVSRRRVAMRSSSGTWQPARCRPSGDRRRAARRAAAGARAPPSTKSSSRHRPDSDVEASAEGCLGDLLGYEEADRSLLVHGPGTYGSAAVWHHRRTLRRRGRGRRSRSGPAPGRPGHRVPT